MFHGHLLFKNTIAGQQEVALLQRFLDCYSCMCYHSPYLIQLNKSICRGWKLDAGQRLVVTGNLPVLGNWQPGHALALTEVCSPVWTAEVQVCIAPLLQTAIEAAV